jgi:arylsulfatase A
MGAERACLIAAGRITLASFLRDNGYATAMVGKWHLGMDFPGDRKNRDWTRPVQDMPLDKGFDYFYGIPASLNYGVLAWFEGRHAKVPPTMYTQKKPNQIAISDYRIMPSYETKLAKPGSSNQWGVVKGQLEVAEDFVDAECLTRFTDKAIEWIEGKAAGAREGKPFFLYLPYTSPHKPVIPLEKFRGRGKAGAYGEFVIETDWHVGRILDLLDRESLTDETLVVFTSDNGPETTWKQRVELFGHRSNGIYREGKRSIYEGGHRVPFFVRWPAQARAGIRYDQPICQTDLLATFAELVGKKLPDHAAEDSVSFMHALLGAEAPSARPPIIHHSSSGRFAIRNGKWKLVMQDKRNQRELYDLSKDPSEENNVIGPNLELADKMTEELSAIVRQGRSTSGPRQPNDTSWWSDLTWMDAW